MDDHLAELMRAIKAVHEREAENPVERPADWIDLPGGGRPAAEVLGTPAEKPKPRPSWGAPAEEPAAPARPATASGPVTKIAAPKPDIGWDLPQKSSGSREPERKVSLGDVARARKDYEREPFERAREAREKREQREEAEKRQQREAAERRAEPEDPTAKGA